MGYMKRKWNLTRRLIALQKNGYDMAIIGKKKMKRAVKFYQSINKFNQEKQWCEITGKAPRMKNRKTLM